MASAHRARRNAIKPVLRFINDLLIRTIRMTDLSFFGLDTEAPPKTFTATRSKGLLPFVWRKRVTGCGKVIVGVEKVGVQRQSASPSLGAIHGRRAPQHV